MSILENTKRKALEAAELERYRDDAAKATAANNEALLASMADRGYKLGVVDATNSLAARLAQNGIQVPNTYRGV